MAGIKVQLKGFDQFKKRLAKAAKEVPLEVDAELQVSANNMRATAIKNAPADQGLLRSEIQASQQSTLNWGIFSNALYSGYVEFGTKSKVQIPAGLEEVAAEIKSGKISSSLDAKTAIFAWCKRKGIEERFWYPIFIKIMVEGMKPHPFFFQSLEQEEPNLIKNVENILKQV